MHGLPRTQRLRLVAAVSICVAALSGGVARAAEAPPSAVAQYMELLPTSTGSAPTRAVPSPSSDEPAPQPRATPEVTETIRARGGSDAAALEHLVNSSPRSRPVEREPATPTVRQGELLARTERGGGFGSTLVAIPNAVGGWDAAGALVLALVLTGAAFSAPLLRRQALS